MTLSTFKQTSNTTFGHFISFYSKNSATLTHGMSQDTMPNILSSADQVNSTHSLNTRRVTPANTHRRGRGMCRH